MSPAAGRPDPTPKRRLSPRTLAVVTGVMAGALVVVVIVVTPWQTLPGGVPAMAPEPGTDFTAAEVSRASRFHADLRPPSYLGWLLGMLVSLALGLTPAGARLVGRLGRWLRRWWAQVPVGVVTLLGVGWVVALPFTAWRETVLRHYGLSTRDWPGWALDQATEFAVAATLTAAAVTLLVGMARRFPRWWVLPAGAGAAGLTVVASFVWPLLVEPLFNDFRPLADRQLSRSLVALAHRDGVVVDRVLVADASRRTTAVNAYVSGFGTTRRLVVYDTLLRQAPDDEVRLVVAHELGHAAARDVLTGTLVAALAAATGTSVLALLTSSARVRRRVGAAGPGDPRVVAFVLAGITVGSVLVGPPAALVSRRVEARADVHALDLTADPDTFVRMQRRLAVSNLAEVHPPDLEFGWFATHPTAPQRNALARAWAARHGAPVPPGLVG